MSAVRDYLEAKAAAGPSEWLRREPRETHPAILEAVREFRAGGGFYDDDAERFVNARVGDLPPHERHGAERHPLIAQLGHEVYIAKGCLDDEEAAARVAALMADGFCMLDASTLEEGRRYTVRFGTLYCGRSVPVFGKPHEVRAKRNGAGLVLAPKGARSSFYRVSGPALVRDGWTS